ncbi:hypothetical protein LCL89_10690 [Halobacillus yeomjeoni]|uniref:hypothetical protein n=1 Tax=Halobacillus yeomjeoni TaxID=311194 RepID=UPI001CD791BF|nr:hypothetical protein [Halobacillus yeomjeoni]MCA0984510.1 hypothetical protein [Halobacillus yeomjeoni]
MKQMLRQCLSMDEYRISAIIVGFFITLGVTMYKYAVTGIIDETVSNLLLTFIYIIAAIQVTNHVKEYAVFKNTAHLQRREDSPQKD